MRMMKYITIALAALTLTSCLSVTKEVKVKPGDAVTVNFRAGTDATKTAFIDQTSAGYYPVRWTDTDNVAVSLNVDGWQTLAAVPSDSRATATFSGEFVAAESYRFYAVSPAAAVKDMNDAKRAWLLNIPWTQTPVSGSADPRAIIIGASTNETASLPNPVTFLFGHLTAYMRLTLTGLTDAYGAVSSIDIVSGRAFAGDWYYSLDDGSFSPRDASRSMHVVTSSVEDIWIACAPVDMSGQDLTVTVNCATGSVRRTVTFPSGRRYTSGMVSTVTIDMSTATSVEVEASTAAFLDNTVPGFYPASGTAVAYEAGANQLCREYVDGKVAFSIVSPATSAIISISEIPADAAMGSGFAITYTSVSDLGIASKSYNVTVVKEDGAMLWLLGSAGDRFIVKK
ncbi:MAG: hypothetical protein IJS07_03415 [Bacteroidales bacterium]|nr:hypothetical protein [Bacteroidales bacterium]